MKKVTKYTHRLVRCLGLDGLLALNPNLLPGLWKLLPTHTEYHSNKFSTVRRGDAKFYLQLSDYMQWHVYANLPEPLWEMAWKRLNEESIVFDVGANIGAFSIKTAAYLHKKMSNFFIYAFEPNSLIYKRLNYNLQLNSHLKSKISTIPLAISDVKGTMYFDSSNNNSGIGKLSSVETNNKVEVCTMDVFVQENDLKKVDLIKIDVEGFEPNVLRGATKVIDRFKPDLILEITDQWFKKNKSSAMEVLNYLSKENGYKLFTDQDRKVTKLNFYNLPPQFNVIAVRD